MKTAAASQPRLTAAEAWREVEARQISLTPALGQWVASVDIKGRGHNSKRALHSLSATASSPIAAVRALIELIQMLDVGETPQLDHRHFRSQIHTKNDLLSS
jgi:hypothetical protein